MVRADLLLNSVGKSPRGKIKLRDVLVWRRYAQRVSLIHSDLIHLVLSKGVLSEEE